MRGEIFVYGLLSHLISFFQNFNIFLQQIQQSVNLWKCRNAKVFNSMLESNAAVLRRISRFGISELARLRLSQTQTIGACSCLLSCNRLLCCWLYFPPWPHLLGPVSSLVPFSIFNICLGWPVNGSAVVRLKKSLEDERFMLIQHIL